MSGAVFDGRLRTEAVDESVDQAGCETVSAADAIENLEIFAVFGFVELARGPRVLLRPSFALTLNDVREKISGGSVSDEATLILDGEGIRLENVTLAGRSALVIHACPGANVLVKNRAIENEGFEIVQLTEAELVDPNTPEYLRIRGYRIENRAAEIYTFDQPGNYTV